MRLAKIVFIVLAVTNYFYVSAQDEESTEPPEEATEPVSLERHSFLALLNIVFEDETKHSCAGTIIHDFVVITAAHCFLSQEDPKQVELSGSFVVIGTKKDFDTGTENYLLIERVLIHPKYKGWTADIALVYTFVEMTGDKSGRIIPIGGEGTTMSSNVAFLSWKRCTDKEGRLIKCSRHKGTTISDCNTNSYEDDDEIEEYNAKRTGTKAPFRMGHPQEEEHSSEQASLKYQPRGYKSPPMLDFENVTTPYKSDAPNTLNEPNNPNESHETNAADEPHEENAPNESHETDAPSDYPETVEPHESLHKTDELKRTREPEISNESFGPKTRNASQKAKARYKKFHDLEPRNVHRETDIPNESNERETILIETDEMPSRRYLFDKNFVNVRENKLREGDITIETFKFTNVEDCKKLVDETMPLIYGINTKETLCYSNDLYHITDTDSGAPIINNGRLVAVTIGGVKMGTDHMGIGLKMDCHCPWIESNLPPENNTLECCTNCCARELPILRKSKREMQRKDRSRVTTFI